MKSEKKKMNSQTRKLFIMSLIIPGSGHLVVKQFKKGIAFIAMFILEILVLLSMIIPIFKRTAISATNKAGEAVYTIGNQPWTGGEVHWYNDSFMILIGAVISVLILIVFALIHYGIARDFVRIKKQIDAGEEVVSIRELMRTVSSDLIPHAVTAPAYIMMLLFILVPSIISIAIAFTNYRKPILPPSFLVEWAGFSNFTDLVTNPQTSKLFEETIVWTVIWTIGSAGLVIFLGVFLAVISHDKRIKGIKFFRSVFLLPWAIPAFLTILIFQIFFSKVGTMNTIVIPFFTGQEYSVASAIGFLTDPLLAKITIILIQGWLGFPFVYMLVTGTLQSIPDDLYEASGIDGGNAWSDFWDITFPIIMITIAPMLITQFTFAFNNVTIIYMLGGSAVKEVGAQYGPLEIMSSLGYQLTLDANYSTAATLSLIVSAVMSVIVIFSWLKSGAFKNEEVM